MITGWSEASTELRNGDLAHECRCDNDEGDDGPTAGGIGGMGGMGGMGGIAGTAGMGDVLLGVSCARLEPTDGERE
jgi:hypothetical protein